MIRQATLSTKPHDARRASRAQRTPEVRPARASERSRAPAPGIGFDLGQIHVLPPAARNDSIHGAVRQDTTAAGGHLDAASRAFFEARLGYDFGSVRVFSDEATTRTVRAMGAAAYTIGSDVFVDRERYQPTTRAGRALLGHELSHVVQQTAGSGHSACSSSDDACEREAAQVSEALARGDNRIAVEARSPIRVACQSAGRSSGAAHRQLSKEEFDHLTDAEVRQEMLRAADRMHRPGHTLNDVLYYQQLQEWEGSRTNNRPAAPTEKSIAHQRTASADQQVALHPGEVADELLWNSSIRPYIEQRFMSGLRATGRQRPHATNALFEAALRDDEIARMRIDPRRTDPATLAALSKIDSLTTSAEGFVDRFGIIHLRPGSGAHSAVHEAVHLYGSRAFARLGFNVNEGANEYFTRVVIDDTQLLPVEIGADQTLKLSYVNQSAAVKDLVVAAGRGSVAAGRALVAAAYFNGEMEPLEFAVGANALHEWADHVNNGRFEQARAALRRGGGRPAPQARGATR